MAMYATVFVVTVPAVEAVVAPPRVVVKDTCTSVAMPGAASAIDVDVPVEMTVVAK